MTVKDGSIVISEMNVNNFVKKGIDKMSLGISVRNLVNCNGIPHRRHGRVKS